MPDPAPSPTPDSSANAVPDPAPSLKPAVNARQLLKELHETFPVFRDCLPLAIGIDKLLLSRLPGLDRKPLRIALGIHTHSLRYLKTIERATERLDLDGQPAGEITATHRSHASEVLKERHKKHAEQRQAQRAADALARQHEEHEEKLGQLVEKFGRQR